MAEMRTLKRLQQIRQLEADQSLKQLELAVGARDRVQRELQTATAQVAQARKNFRQSIFRGDGVGRSCSLIEIENFSRVAEMLKSRLAGAQLGFEMQLKEYMADRTRRKQMEALVEEKRAENERIAARRAQETIDDCYGRARMNGGNQDRK